MKCPHNCTPDRITCKATGGKGPYAVDLPYPEIRVMCQNEYYAQLLSMDFAGQVSELSAITQYINHEVNASPICCELAQTLLGIAIVEMRHLQMLGQTIILLGGEAKYKAFDGYKEAYWDGDLVNYTTNLYDMVLLNIQAEEDAIAQYQEHVYRIDDLYVKEILERIILDEQLHVKILKDLLKNWPC